MNKLEGLYSYDVDLKKLRNRFGTKYTLHYGDINKLTLPITVLSIDPGTKSMGIRIDKISEEKSQCIYENIVELEDTDSFPYSVLRYIENIIEYIPQCNLILLERQLSVNKNMIVVENVLCSIFMAISFTGKILLDRYVQKDIIHRVSVKKLMNNNCCIVSVSSKLKGIFYKDKMDKKLSFDIAKGIIDKRYPKINQKDWNSMRLKNLSKDIKKMNAKQRSDIGDTVLQMYAFILGIGLLDSI